MKKILLSAVSLLFVGCATTMAPSTYKFPVTSSPSGGKVFVDGNYVATTPAEVVVAPRQPHVVEVRKEGYATSSTHVGTKVGGGFLVFDALMLVVPPVGLAAFGIDAITGAWTLPDTYGINVTLEKDGK